MIENKIKRFVAWGHKLHSHTHSYIHNAFIRAFQHLGYPTLWLDNNDDSSEIDFEGSLFLTEGCVETNIPVREDCYYILHNCSGTQFVDIPQNHIIVIQVFTKGIFDGRSLTYIEPCIYHEGRTLYMPWATDLLPYEINDSIRCLDTNKSESILHFVGYRTEVWNEVKKYCDTHHITYHEVGGFIRYDDKLGYISTNVDVNDNITLIRESS